jgi:AdoMet-dependent heme synthase
MRPEPGKSQSDASPIVVWELTRACRVQCMHCAAGAQAKRSPLELSTYESYKTIDQIVAVAPRELIITGGDPLERADVFQLIDYARRRGIRPAVTLTPSRVLNGAVFAKLRSNGVERVIFPIDGPDPERHDAVRGVAGHFTGTLQAIRWARTSGLPLEINTLVTGTVFRNLASVAGLVSELGAVRWNLYFIVPVRGSRDLETLNAEEIETAFGRIHELSANAPFEIRTFEAPQYTRYVMQRVQNVPIPPDILFISHTGEVGVSPFVPTAAGNVRYQPLSWVYHNSDLLVALRDDRNIKGKCGRCDYRAVCRGSRARAFATTGDLFASDPLCAYQPAAPEV